MRVCVITAGHVSTSPRMLKAADALVDAGHDVRVVRTLHMEWATETDRDVIARRRWRSTVVDYRAGSRTRVISGARFRTARAVASAAGVGTVPYGLAIRAFSRTHDELVAAALAEPADFFYGGTTGGLTATPAAAGKRGVRFGVDLEDYYRGQHAEPGGRLDNRLAARIEERVVPRAACVTAAGSAIADEYGRLFGRTPVAINNTFPLPTREPEFDTRPSTPLRFYWFSQTIGPGRGLEEAIRAIALAGIDASLTLRGRPVDGYADEILTFARGTAPRLALTIAPPVSPDAVIASCRDHDIGLSVEQPDPPNRLVCLGNKPLTYVLAGLAVILSDLPGSRPLAADLGAGAIAYSPGHPEDLAPQIRALGENRERLLCARRSAWDAAVRRWHWEHARERGALVAAIEASAR